MYILGILDIDKCRGKGGKLYNFLMIKLIGEKNLTEPLFESKRQLESNLLET